MKIGIETNNGTSYVDVDSPIIVVGTLGGKMTTDGALVLAKALTRNSKVRHLDVRGIGYITKLL